MNVASVRIEREGHVAHLVLAAPARRNALTPGMAAELVALCEELDADDSVGAVVVRGEGGSFCSGADRDVLSAVAADTTDPQAIADLRAIYSAFVRVGHLEAPTIGAIQGAAVGAGLNLAASTDLRIIAESARLIAGFQRIGLHPGGGHFALLGRALGYPATVALTVFGQEIDGRRAAEIGFAWAAVADDEVVSSAVAIADTVASDPALARAVVRSARHVIGPPALSWEIALELELNPQLWSMDRRDKRVTEPRTADSRDTKPLEA
jgi:enoyl-CoA hydratase